MLIFWLDVVPSQFGTFVRYKLISTFSSIFHLQLDHYPSCYFLFFSIFNGYLFICLFAFSVQVYQLVDSLIRNEKNDTALMVRNIIQITFTLHLQDYFPNTLPLLVQEVYNIDGRWCIKSSADRMTSFNGLLLSRSVNNPYDFQQLLSVKDIFIL